MGIKNLSKFETITKPDLNTIARALETLYFIGILDENSNLTEIGIKACDIPIDPRLSVALINSALGKFKCSEEVLIICSMLAIPNLFYQSTDPAAILRAKQRHGVIEGDHLTYLSIYKNWKNCKTSKSTFCRELHLNENSMKQADEIYNNLKLYFKKFQLKISSSLDEDGEDVLKSLMKGFFLNIAQKQYDGSYKSLRTGIKLHLHPTSVLYTIMPEFLFYSDVVTSTKNYMKDASKIEKNWIMEIADNYYVDKAQQVIRERHKMEVKNQIKMENENLQKKLLGDKVPKAPDAGQGLLRVDNKFFFEKEKTLELKSTDKAGKLAKLGEGHERYNFKSEDKIFENDFGQLDEQRKKFLLEDASAVFEKGGQQNTNINNNNEKKNYLINKYLKADVEEDDENNILNINPINPKYLETQRLQAGNNKPEKDMILDLNENKNSSTKTKVKEDIEEKEEKLNYEELFDKNRINEDKKAKAGERNLFLSRKKKLIESDSNEKAGNHEDSLLEIKNRNLENLGTKEGGKLNENKETESGNAEKLPEDEEERIAMLRRKKNIKKPEKFKI